MRINMPSCYIQESGAISKIPSYFDYLDNNKALIIMDEFAHSNFKNKVMEGFKNSDDSCVVEEFKSECSMDNINIFIEKASNNNTKVVVGIGGGKVLDVAKAVGHFGNMKCIMVPTSAATDGPCSKISVLYENDGTFKEYIHLRNNPNGVVVDTEVIANAPVRLLKAGLGDALSTYFETEAGYAGDMDSNDFSNISATARVLSEQCLYTILRYGERAINAVENKEVNEALNRVVESIIYLSCAGFENGSLAAAHSIANALSTFPKYNHLMHGEKVAFGTIVQIVLEGIELDTIRKVRDFCRRVKLPYNMTQVGIENREEAIKIATIACGSNQPINNMKKIFVDPRAVESAIMYTNNFK